MRSACALTVFAGALSAVGWTLEERTPSGADSMALLKDDQAGSVTTSPVSETSRALATLASKLDECIRTSRSVLLGSRDPNGPSCVKVVTRGQVQNMAPDNLGDWNGGPGTTMGTLYYYDRKNNQSPLQDFNWHQIRLKTYLQNQAAINQVAGDIARESSEEAKRFYEMVNSWTTFPADVQPVSFTRETDWPSYCMSALNRAIKARDLEETKRWAGELAGATFALDDLHLWLGFLVDNHLTALEFQLRCHTLFVASDALRQPYDPQSTISQFPAGVLSLNGISNYYEVERQAERIFSMPADRLEELSDNANLTPASLWILPGSREAFVKMQSALGPANQKAWELAARTPYQHSYLINMLFRSTHANTADDMLIALKKFDSINPNASVGELMGALMYRGHSFAGLEWDDRFQTELINASEEIDTSETDSDALLQAGKWTNRFSNPDDYASTFTLRDALKRKQLDCVRATDMIGAIFRNAGRTRFGHVRWCVENGGHSVAAYLGTENGKSKTILVDGLNPPEQPEVWPDAYFNGHEWPVNMTEHPTPYAVELYGRGLDSYVWFEGYIVRGPNAGYLTTANIPYAHNRRVFSTRKVFDGPYPQ